MAEASSHWRPSERWTRAHSDLDRFLRDLNVEDALTVLVRFVRIPLNSAEELAEMLQAAKEDPDEEWASMVLDGQGPTRYEGLAMKVLKGSGDSLFGALFPYVEIHTAMVAWWLITAWRTHQLATAGMSMAEQAQYVPSAAMVRPLVETAASFWCDGLAIGQAWRQVKESADPLQSGNRDRTYSLLTPLRQALFAGKFREPPAPDLERTNILTHVGKLVRVAEASLDRDYELLCNTVHPSLGNLKAFQTPTVSNARFAVQELTVLASKPLLLGGTTGVEQELELPEALDRAASIALEILLKCLDRALSLIDDVALVSRAPSLAGTRYWRMVEVPTFTTEACPCRSGLRWEKCQDRYHRWGTDAETVALPSTFR